MMEHSKDLPLERPKRTYQRSHKAVLHKKLQLENNIKQDIDILENHRAPQVQSKYQADSDSISIRRTLPPEMLVINIEEVINSTQFDPELLNAVKPRVIYSSQDRMKPEKEESREHRETEEEITILEVPRRVRVDFTAMSEVQAKPCLSMSMTAKLKVTEAKLANLKESEAVQPKARSSQAVKSEPDSFDAVQSAVKLPEAVQLKVRVSEAAQPKPRSSQALKSEPGSFDAVQSTAKVSEAAQLKVKVSEVAQVKTEVSDAAQSATVVSEIVQVKAEVSDAAQSATVVSEIVQVKAEVSDAAQSATVVSEIVQVKAEVSDPAQSTPKISEAALSKLKGSEATKSTAKVSEAAQSTAKLSEAAQLKAKDSDAAQLKMKVSEAAQPEAKRSVAVQSMMNISEGARFKAKFSKAPQWMEKVSDPLQLKAKFSKAPQSKPKVPETSQFVSEMLAKVSEAVLSKPKRTVVVQSILKSSGEPHSIAKVLERVQGKAKYSNAVRSIPKYLATSKPSEAPPITPKVRKAAEMKQKAPMLKPASVKLRELKMPTVKAMLSEGRRFKQNKRGEAVLVVKKRRQMATTTPLRSTPRLTVPEEKTNTPNEPKMVKLFSNLPEYIEDFVPGSNSDAPSVSLLALHPIPLPIVEAKSSRPVNAVKLVQEHVLPLLPRRWSLRVEDDGIFAMLFAPGLKCAVQRAVYASFDGKELKFIVHGKVIPKDHSVYQYRLMQAPLRLAAETVQKFANVVMGAIHSVIQHHICVGLDDVHLDHNQRERAECRLDENFYEEEGFDKTLRSINCTFLVRRKNTKRCSECLFYNTLLRNREKRKNLSREVQLEVQEIASKKLKASNR